MRPNTIRQALNEGRPTFATHVFSQWPTIVEIIGYTGAFDYVEFSGEYAPYDLFSLDNFCRAAELHGMSSMMKIDQEPRKYLAQRAIGAGFQSVLFADIRGVDDVREAVAAVRSDSPQGGGTYGAADRRAMLMYSAGTPRYIEALDEIVVAVMIEKASAVEQLDEILAVPGVDMVQWGPADYSMSIGRIGEWAHPDIKKIERDVFERCIAAGVPPRLELNRPEDAAPYLEMGVRHFCMNADIYILHDWLKQNGRALRDLVEGAASSAPQPASVGYRGANPGADAISPAAPGSR